MPGLTRLGSGVVIDNASMVAGCSDFLKKVIPHTHSSTHTYCPASLVSAHIPSDLRVILIMKKRQKHTTAGIR
jgi:hypothetical protein